jgi:hypothetical protein
MASSDPFQDRPKGYPKLAARTEVQPELAIYRRFGALNAQNLLYYQAELVDIEEKLMTQQVKDSQDTTGAKQKYSSNWFRLKVSATDGDTKQLDLVTRMREILKEYSQYNLCIQQELCSLFNVDHALIQQSFILNYPKPADWDLHFIQDFLQSNEMGPLALIGKDAEVWGSYSERHSHSADLVTLKPRVKQDTFSVWAAETGTRFARYMKPSPVHGVVGFEDTVVYRITYWITSILASLILILSIVVLYLVHSMPVRLGTIAAFNILVSICLMGLTNAKRTEVFAITAAYVLRSTVSDQWTDISSVAAVQVVFVGTDKSS